jgi:hypothetical protein
MKMVGIIWKIRAGIVQERAFVVVHQKRALRPFYWILLSRI